MNLAQLIGPHKATRITNVRTCLEAVVKTDIIHKMSFSGGSILQGIASKLINIDALNIPDEKVDEMFTEEERTYVYGCFLLGNAPVGGGDEELGAASNGGQEDGDNGAE